jgi:AraC-like DNA-binding protein
MGIADYFPAPILQPFIQSYKIIESEGVLLNRVLPNPSFAIAFRLNGRIAHVEDQQVRVMPGATFAGMRKSFRMIEYGAGAASLIVLFKDMGAAGFFKEPLHEVFEETIGLDSFFAASEIARVEEQLAGVKEHKDIVRVVESFLIDKLLPVPPDNRLVAEAVEKIKASGGVNKMSQLAAELYCSQDAFEKKFRKLVGATPKQFASIIRLHRIVRQGQLHPSLIDLALDNGYFDQAHFNKDFKKFTGSTPKDFFGGEVFW